MATATLLNVKAINIGLSNANEEVSFNQYSESGRTSFFTHGDGAYTVEKGYVTTGDKIVKELNIPNEEIDLLKIDVEGAEYLVLLGFRETLAKGKIGIIQFEHACACAYGFSLKEFYKYFESIGYSLGKLYPEKIIFRPYVWNLEMEWGSNWVAIRNDLKAKFLVNS